MKQEATENVLVALRRILRREMYVSDRIASAMLRQIASGWGKPEQAPIARLSDRELEVFRLIGEGHGTRQIADELHLSVKTVESYQAHIKEKLACRARVTWCSGRSNGGWPRRPSSASCRMGIGDSPMLLIGKSLIVERAGRACLRQSPPIPNSIYPSHRAAAFVPSALRADCATGSRSSPLPSLGAWKERLCLATVPYGRTTQKPPAVSDVHVLWITAGLGCDGDSVSITAATQPSIEDVVLGAIPGLPKVHLHNPVLAYEVGDEFLKSWYQAEEGKLDPFVLVVEGSIPNEKIKKEGYWAAMGTDARPASRSRRASGSTGWRPRPWRSWRPAPAPPTAASTRWRAIRPAAMGLADYLGWDWKSKAGLPIVNVPGCPVQPDNFMETLLYLLYQAAGLAPMIPLDDQLRPTWLFGKTVHEGCDRGGYYEQGDFATSTARPSAW